LYVAKQKPTQAEIDAAIEDVMNNDSLDEVVKKFMIEIIKKAVESPETLTSDLQKANENMLYVLSKSNFWGSNGRICS
jgi:fructose-specific component phosphotransferase system IIB-like protein